MLLPSGLQVCVDSRPPYSAGNCASLDDHSDDYSEWFGRLTTSRIPVCDTSTPDSTTYDQNSGVFRTLGNPPANFNTGSDIFLTMACLFFHATTYPNTLTGRLPQFLGDLAAVRTHHIVCFSFNTFQFGYTNIGLLGYIEYPNYIKYYANYPSPNSCICPEKESSQITGIKRPTDSAILHLLNC
jgi:hypothetical protein